MVWRQRDSFAMIDSTVAVQTKGLGFSFQASKNSSMALCRSATLAKEPRRILLLVNSPNQRSTRFNQLELVGTKCADKPGVTLEPGLHVGMLVGAVIVHHQVQSDICRGIPHPGDAGISETPDGGGAYSIGR